MELRQTILSRSAVSHVNTNYGRNEVNAYLLVRQIASQYKHPIIIDYKSQLTNIRKALDLSDRKFREYIGLALRLKFATIEGKHLRLLSMNQDRKYFKQTKKNDYKKTSNPELFKNLTLLYAYYKKQVFAISKKSGQTYLTLDNSDRRPNYAITLSCRAVSKLLQLNSTSKAKSIIDQLSKRGLIKLNKNTQEIDRNEFDNALKRNDRTIRYDKEKKKWFRVLASTFEPNFDFKRVKLSAFDRLPEQVKITYLELGYTVEQIERMVA